MCCCGQDGSVNSFQSCHTMFSRATLPLIRTWNNLTVSNLDSPNNLSPILQLVRWRKRRWAPRAASKKFYVRKPTPQDPVEKAELVSRYTKYFTMCRALRQYFREEVEEKAALRTSTLQSEREEQEWAAIMEENDRWNQETGRVRMLHQKAEEEEENEKRLDELIAYEEQQAVAQQKAREKVLMEMENVKSFIREDNLEAEIEKALNMRVNYNYAIDLEGNRYIEAPDGSIVAETEDVKEPQSKQNI